MVSQPHSFLQKIKMSIEILIEEVKPAVLGKNLSET